MEMFGRSNSGSEWMNCSSTSGVMRPDQELLSSSMDWLPGKVDAGPLWVPSSGTWKPVRDLCGSEFSG